jgi:dihydrofolate synthase/folylpolyglutamate synthase
MTRAPGPSGPETVRKGLSRMRRALARSGNPERAFRTLHVAGTNGKGSTACFLEAILRAISGMPIGLYTSPHLLSPEERIRVDGRKISSRELRSGFRAAERLGGQGDPLTYFETMTWVACDWFRRKGVPLAVMETGLGGRWDATTACRSAVSVITTVGVDHRDWLGNTLGEIAGEKAGILKKGIPVVMGRIRPSARAVVRRRARSLGCPAWELGKDYGWSLHRDGTLTVGLPGVTVRGIRLRMDGGFQRDNAAVALAAAWRWAKGEGIPPSRFRAGAASAMSAACWPGRFCRLPGRPNAGAWVDGGHNPDAAGTLAREIAVSPPWGKGKRLVALWSMLADKDHAGYLRALAPCLHGAVTYPLRHDRATDAGLLADRARSAGVPCVASDRFPQAWRAARRLAGKDGVVLVCGSLATAADAYRHRVGSLR